MIAAKAVAAIAVALALTGCATTPLSFNRYSSTENLQQQALAEGTVIRTMPIRVSDSQAATANGTIGALAGAATGYAIGNNVIGAVAGLLGGAIIGNVVTPGSVAGTEVMVKLTNGQLLGVPEVGHPNLATGVKVAILRGANGKTRAVPLS